MKMVYIYLAIALLLGAALFALSFLYIDRQGHQTFLYAVYEDKTLVGYEKIDRYTVENKLIYKSFLELPRDMLRRKTNRKIVLDSRGKGLMDYTEETDSSGAKSLIYVKNDKLSVSFLGIADAAFTCLDNMTMPGTFSILENKVVATYLPLIRQYNFKKRGEQFFNTLTPISQDLPPLPDKVSITAIGKDIITLGGKKIKCENLVFEFSSGELASVWVARAFHNILMVKIPKTGFKAVLCAKKDNIPVEEYAKKSAFYSEREMTFSNGDLILNGVISVPSKAAPPYPAVLLIWGGGPQDSGAMGMFTDMAAALAENGYCVFRFDKRGVGKSQGLFSTYDQAEEISDLRKAVELLCSIPDIVDKTRLAVLGYAEGAFYAAYLSSLYEEIKACVLMSAAASTDMTKDNFKKVRDFIKNNVTSDPQYQKAAVSAILQSTEMTSGGGDWITKFGVSVFTKKIKARNNYDIIEALKKVKTPVLMLHGGKDAINPARDAKKLEETLSESGNRDVTAVYLDDMDHLMGKVVKNENGGIRDHIALDTRVTKSVISWLNDNLISTPSSSPKPGDTGSLGRIENSVLIGQARTFHAGPANRIEYAKKHL